MTRRCPAARRIAAELAVELEANSQPEPNSGCLLWCRCVSRNGYGSLRVGNRTHSVHRLAWEVNYGPIPPGMHVLHKCDVRSCINPAHLFIGTNADNVRDKVVKGRQLRGIDLSWRVKRGISLSENRQRRLSSLKGAKNPASRLTDEQVAAIRADRRSQRVIAREFGITQPSICLIKAGKSWRHLHDEALHASPRPTTTRVRS